jgi:hypothetical protein
VVIAVGIAVAALSQTTAGARPHHHPVKRIKRCGTAQITVLKLRDGKRVVGKPGHRLPKGAHVACVKVPPLNTPTAPVTSTSFDYAFSQLVPGLQRKLHALDVVMQKLMAALDGADSAAPAMRARRAYAASPRASAAASSSSSASSGDATGSQNAHSSTVDTADSYGFDGGGDATGSASGKDGSGEASMSASKHYQNDKCPGADGKLRNGTYHQDLHEAIRFHSRKYGYGGSTIDADENGTYEADVGDDGEPTELTMDLSGEIRTHKAIPPHDYDYSLVDFSTTITMNLKDPNGPWQSTPPKISGRGNIDPASTVKMYKSMVNEAVSEAANNVEHKAWQTPNVCAQLQVKADKQTAPTGGQIKLTFTAKAHDGSPLTTPLTITSSCPGMLSDSHPTTDGSGTVTISLSDPKSQWKGSTGACISATMQTRAGKGEAHLAIPPPPPSKDHVTGSLSLSVTHNDTCSTGDANNEVDNWSGTGNIDESYDPTSTANPFTHSSTLSFSGTWSSGGCGDPIDGYSGTDSGSSNASVSGHDGISDSNGGVSAYWDTPAKGQLALYLYWPVNGTDNCQDLGTSHVTGNLGTEIDVAIPAGGSGTVSIDKMLSYGSGDNQWTNGWGPSCSGTPPDSYTKVHLTGTLTIHHV